MLYSTIFITTLLFIVFFRNKSWNNWIFVALFLIAVSLLAIAIENGFGEPLAINHKTATRNPITEFYSADHYDLQYDKPLVKEEEPPKTWAWWILSFEFFLLSFISVPIVFYDDCKNTFNKVLTKYQLRTQKIKKRKDIKIAEVNDLTKLLAAIFTSQILAILIVEIGKVIVPKIFKKR